MAFALANIAKNGYCTNLDIANAHAITKNLVNLFTRSLCGKERVSRNGPQNWVYLW